MTRMKPRARSAKVPFNAAFTDSTTCLLPIDSRHAVVPNGILWVQGNSAGMAVRMPPQQCSQPSSTETNGTVLGRRMVLGKQRARSSPAQKGHRQRVAPSGSGPA